MALLQIPDDVEVLESPGSIYWFGKDGIVYSISRKADYASIDEIRDVIENFKRTLNGQKVCMLVDVTNSQESTREARDYAAVEFPKFVKAIAMISNSALGKMLANLFFTIKTQPYPTKMFNTEAEAREWLQQYL